MEIKNDNVRVFGILFFILVNYLWDAQLQEVGQPSLCPEPHRNAGSPRNVRPFYPDLFGFRRQLPGPGDHVPFCKLAQSNSCEVSKLRLQSMDERLEEKKII